MRELLRDIVDRNLYHVAEAVEMRSATKNCAHPGAIARAWGLDTNMCAPSRCCRLLNLTQ